MVVRTYRTWNEFLGVLVVGTIHFQQHISTSNYYYNCTTIITNNKCNTTTTLSLLIYHII